jgi:hypothetical protein
LFRPAHDLQPLSQSVIFLTMTLRQTSAEVR